MKINNKYIRTGDPASTIIDKSNFNFDQILASGFGGTGFNGVKGPTGVIGKIGPDGPQGATGVRGSNWYQQNTSPSTAGASPYDYWINTSSTNQDQVYYYAGPTSGWIDSGASLRTNGVFAGVQSLLGPEGATGYSAIVINGTGGSQARTTFVYSDTVFSAINANPNLAKVLISTDSESNDGAILGFSKTTTNAPGYPSFYWASTGTDYSLSFETNSTLSITSGKEFGIHSDSTFYLSSSVLDFKSGGVFSLGATGNISITSDPSIQITSTELSFRGNQNTLNVPLILSKAIGSTGSYKIDVEGSLFKSGLILTSAGATSSPDLLKINNTDGINLLKTKQNSQTVIGLTGSTGAHIVDGFRSIDCKFIPTGSTGSITYGIVDLTSPDYFNVNKIYLAFPSNINTSYVDPRFYVSLPSPSLDIKISNPGHVSVYKIFNGGTGYKLNGIAYQEKKNIGNNAVILERRIDFPNPDDVEILTLTYTGDQSSFFYNIGATGAFVNMNA
jgi:hypothetical protein